MSWSLTVKKTHVKNFAAAVDAARAEGNVAEGISGLQITQAKAMLTALAAAGAVGADVEIKAQAGGHGISPGWFQVYVSEDLDVASAQTAGVGISTEIPVSQEPSVVSVSGESADQP